MIPIQHIAVGVSEDAMSLYAGKYAIYLARVLQARLTAVHVVNLHVINDLLKSRIFVETESRELAGDLEEQGSRLLARIKKMAESHGVACEINLRKGRVHEEVVNLLRDQETDLLVMGNPECPVGRLAGQYAEGRQILHLAPCPVLVVKNMETADRLYRSLSE